MKHNLALVALLGAVVPAFSIEMTAPEPDHTESFPYEVESPVRVDWKSNYGVTVTILRSGRTIFPNAHDLRSVPPGTQFHLDPGVYQILMREVDDPYTEETWIRVNPKPLTIDLRSSDAATRSQVADLQAQLEKLAAEQRSRMDTIRGALDGQSDRIGSLAGQLDTMDARIGEILKKFTFTVVGEDGKPVTIDRPFDWVADKITEIEGTCDKERERKE